LERNLTGRKEKSDERWRANRPEGKVYEEVSCVRMRDEGWVMGAMVSRRKSGCGWRSISEECRQP